MKNKMKKFMKVTFVAITSYNVYSTQERMVIGNLTLNAMKTLFFVFLVTLLLACSNERKGGATEVQKIDLSGLSFNSSLKLSSFAESVEIIPLETTSQSLIGEIRKIYYRNGRYYMLVTSGLNNAKALVFTEQGKFLYALDRIGQGKGEYIEMGTFVLMPNADIKVLGWTKTVTYDSIGNYLYEAPMSYYAHDAVVFPNGSYVLRHTNLGGLPNKGLYAFTEKDEEISSFLEVSPVEKTKLHNFLNWNAFSTYGGKHYFTYSHADTIYSLEVDKATPAFYFDFGKYKVDYSEVEPNDGVLAIDKKISNKEYVTLWGFQFYSDLLMLGLGFNDKTSLCFYSLKTGKFINGIRIVDDMYLKKNILKLKYTNLPHVIIDGYLYAPISPIVLMNGYANCKQSMSSQEWNEFRNKHAYLVDLCEKISEEDNPVLLKIKLKNRAMK